MHPSDINSTHGEISGIDRVVGIKTGQEKVQVQTYDPKSRDFPIYLPLPKTASHAFLKFMKFTQVVIFDHSRI